MDVNIYGKIYGNDEKACNCVPFHHEIEAIRLYECYEIVAKNDKDIELIKASIGRQSPVCFLSMSIVFTSEPDGFIVDLYENRLLGIQ